MHYLSIRYNNFVILLGYKELLAPCNCSMLVCLLIDLNVRNLIFISQLLCCDAHKIIILRHNYNCDDKIMFVPARQLYIIKLANALCIYPRLITFFLFMVHYLKKLNHFLLNCINI